VIEENILSVLSLKFRNIIGMKKLN